MQRTRCYYFYDGAARCNKREPGSGCDALDGFNLAEYHVPVQADIPFIDIVYTDLPDPHTPLGAHGIGEIGITGVAAAIANAVYHATGTRVTDLPITLDKLL
jgi:CO/xanthine dehydrogenase Mo-binding subunit